MELRTYLNIPGVVVASFTLCAYIRFSEVAIALLVLTLQVALDN